MFRHFANMNLTAYADLLNKGLRVLKRGIHTISVHSLYAAIVLPTLVMRYRASVPRTGGRSDSLLLVTWLFAPLITGGIYRPAALCRYAHDRGREVTVIAGPAPDSPSQAGLKALEFLPSAVRIIRAGSPRWQLPRLGFPSVDGGLLRALSLVKAGWSAFQSEPPRVVVASGPPFATFIAGYYLARVWRVPLVLDYRDEWTECPFEFVEKGGFNRHWEERCLKAAALVVFTTKSMLEHQIDIFKYLDRKKCAVVPNGWEPGDNTVQIRKPLDEAQSERRITLLFAGNLASHTLPGPFLKAIASVISRNPELEERLQIIVLGQKSETALRQLREFPFPRVLELRDQVPKSIAAEMMQAVSALLLINEPRLDRYVPGKLYDYIASRTPILIYGAGGESARLVSKLQAGQVVREGDIEELEAFINGLAIERLRTDNLPQIGDWLNRHTRQATSLAFLNLLDEIS